MKEIFKMGVSLFGKMIVVNIMCFFLAISLSVLTTALFTKDVGNTVFVTDAKTNELVTQYEHYYADGEDTKLKEYEDSEEYKVTSSVIKSQLSKGANNGFYIVTQIMCAIMVLIFTYPNLWDRGTRDNNLVTFGHANEDKLKGLKVGFIAAAPSILFSLFLLITKSNIMAKFPVGILKIMYSSCYGINYAIFGNVIKLGDLSYLQLILSLLLNFCLPIIAYGSYLLGYKNISIGEKLVYKKEKK